MYWNLPIQLLILFTLQLSNFSQARNVKQIHPSAVVVGTVYCDTCFQDDFSRSSHFISGATVSLECKSASFKTEVKTDDQGQFKVPLPFSVSQHEKEIKGCQVKLLKSSEPYCATASTSKSTSSSIQLKSRKPGAGVFSAGFFTFKPLKQPDLCNRHPSTASSTKFSSQKSLPTNPGKSIARPQFFFPPIFPSPPPAITIPLPPNPLQPPPLIPLPPNPLQPPSPPPFGIPTIPGLPGSTPSPPPFGLPRIPGLPGLTPSPPPPPALPIPFPPLFPIPPLPPLIPGVPPAKKVSP